MNLDRQSLALSFCLSEMIAVMAMSGDESSEQKQII